MSGHKRTYKDSVFVDLFARDKTAKANLLSLYNALHGTDLDETCELKHLKLEDSIYMKFSNDVSCLIDNKIIVLAEHQSTINENMPLRCLEYIARLYEQIQEPSVRYYRTLQKIPTPEFYVFYNGKENYPVNKTLKLSDAFITKPVSVPLELTVQVLNINKNKAHKILKTCKMLDEYSLFVEEVRIQRNLDPENGFTNAVKICIQKGILKEYLQRKSREVINMLLAEYDYDTDIAVQRQESLMLGIRQGIERGAYQTKLETARLMKQANCQRDFIMQITGLPAKEIDTL